MKNEEMLPMRGKIRLYGNGVGAPRGGCAGLGPTYFTILFSRAENYASGPVESLLGTKRSIWTLSHILGQ